MVKRYTLFVLVLVGTFLVTAKNARAQTIGSALGYNRYDLTGYSYIGNNPYGETEDCFDWATDGGTNEDSTFCLDGYVYEPWVGQDGYLNNILWGSDWEATSAEVDYDISYPGAGSYSAMGYSTVGETQYEVECIDVNNCGAGIYEGWWLIAAYYSYSNEVDIAHVTSAAYSGSFYAPGTLNVNATFDGPCSGSYCNIDYTYTGPNGISGTATNWPNGSGSFVSGTQTQYFGQWILGKVKASTDGDWAYVTLPIVFGLTEITIQAPVVTLTATGTPESGKPKHFISLINSGNVGLTATVLPNNLVLTWTGATITDNLHGTVSTAAAGDTQVTVCAQGACDSVTVHVVNATAPPASTPAMQTVTNAGAIPMSSAAEYSAFGLTSVGLDPRFLAPYPTFVVNPYFSGNQWVFRLASVTGYYSEGWLALGSPGPGGAPLIDLPTPAVAAALPLMPGFNLVVSATQATSDLDTSTLVPVGANVSGPNRSFYWVQNITIDHENYHRNDFYTNYWPGAMTTFQTTDVENPANASVVYDCYNAPTTTGPGAISQETAYFNGQIHTRHQNANSSYFTNAELRAHTVTNPEYVPIWLAIP